MDSHLFLAHAVLSNYEGVPGPVTNQEREVKPEPAEPEDDEETFFEAEGGEDEEIYELGMTLAFPTKPNADGTPGTLGEASLLTFQKEEQEGALMTTDAVQKINRVMLSEHALFAKAPFWIDWYDMEWNSNDFGSLIDEFGAKGGYGIVPPMKYKNDRIPAHVNPYELPSPLCPRNRFIRLRLNISAGLRAHFSSLAHLDHLGFDQIKFGPRSAQVFESTSDETWTTMSASKKPDIIVAKVPLRIDIEKAPSISEITKTLQFAVPASTQFSNRAMAYAMDIELSYIEESTNIKLGVKGNDKDDAEAAFTFLFPNDNRATLTYHLSENLAARLKSPSQTIERTTTLGKLDINTEEQLASNVLTAQMAGLIYIVSPHGRDQYWPGKLLGMLEPQDDGSFTLINVPFNSIPLIADGTFLASLPNGQLHVQLYIHNPSDAQFYPLRWHENLKLQGCFVYRQKI
jgi:hypothetical protein